VHLGGSTWRGLRGTEFYFVGVEERERGEWEVENGLCVISKTPYRPPIFFGALTQTQDKTTATMAYHPPPHSSWTDAVQSCLRDARRNQSHQRTQWNVLWQRGGRGWRRGWVAAALLP
jgi:hypothetical protein